MVQQWWLLGEAPYRTALTCFCGPKRCTHNRFHEDRLGSEISTNNYTSSQTIVAYHTWCWKHSLTIINIISQHHWPLPVSAQSTSLTILNHYALLSTIIIDDRYRFQDKPFQYSQSPTIMAWSKRGNSRTEAGYHCWIVGWICLIFLHWTMINLHTYDGEYQETNAFQPGIYHWKYSLYEHVAHQD